MVAALVMLLVVFGGALLAALLPLVTALLALGIGVSLIGLLSHAFDISSASTQLAILIGLGVGVDYGLFIISRHRTAVQARAVLRGRRCRRPCGPPAARCCSPACTVCIALLGQFALGVSFLYGVSVAAAIAVALTMATSLTFLPAMLGFLGPRVLSRRERRALAAGTARIERDRRSGCAGPGSSRPARSSWPWRSLAVVVVLALPVFGLRLGSADASTDPAGWTTHQAYTALAQRIRPRVQRAARAGRAGPAPRPASQPSASSSPPRPGRPGWPR